MKKLLKRTLDVKAEGGSKMALLEVENLEVSYGDMQVLWGISFHVKKGEIVAILGPNGAGKTTTLETISGLLQPQAGTVMLKNEDITGMDASKISGKGISHIPEGRRVFSSMTVAQNLKAGAFMKKARKRYQQSLDEVFELFPRLEERQDQRAGTLSGGERQMLAIARGLMLQPDIIMFDEPSLGLQPNLVDEIIDLIVRLNEEGYTVLLVEQNAEQALDISDRAYVLENGRIALEGKCEELRKSDHVQEAYLGM